MKYFHSSFILDTESRTVFDENQKKLRLTGNAYRVLVFLCANGSATLTQLGDFLDHAKDFSENHIRQYRYKINTIIGKDVVMYENGVYSLFGGVSDQPVAEASSRNTDSLHRETVQSNHNNSVDRVTTRTKMQLWPIAIVVVMLLLSFLDWSSYGYYTSLKFVSTGVAIYYAIYLYNQRKQTGFWFWSLVVIAVLFNPVVPVYLYEKGLWMTIDVVVIAFYVGVIYKFRK